MRRRRIRPSEAFLPQLRDKINTELKTGQIYPAQDSAACSMFMIKKHDWQNEARFLHDLVDRNTNTRKDNTPIPDIPSIINPVARHPDRSKIDLTDGYHNVRIKPEVKNLRHSTHLLEHSAEGLCNEEIATYLPHS